MFIAVTWSRAATQEWLVPLGTHSSITKLQIIFALIALAVCSLVVTFLSCQRVLHLCIQHSQMIHSYSFNQFSRLPPQFVWLLVTAEPLSSTWRGGWGEGTTTEWFILRNAKHTHTHSHTHTYTQEGNTKNNNSNGNWGKSATMAATSVALFCGSRFWCIYFCPCNPQTVRAARRAAAWVAEATYERGSNGFNRRGCHLMPSSVGSIAGYE